MKKILLLVLVPFFIQAQTPVEDKAIPAAEKEAAVQNTKEQKKQLLETYRQRILKGEDFGKLARLYSEDPGSAKEGGKYSNVAKGTMVAEFEEACSKLKPGEISEVFETAYGFHFVQLMDRKGDTYSVRHILLMF